MFVSLNSRLKNLLGPVSRVIMKKKMIVAKPLHPPAQAESLQEYLAH
jgi:hypothetical protein